MAVPHAAIVVIADQRRAEVRQALNASRASLGPLAAVRSQAVFAPNAPILIEGDPADHLFRITAGVVKVHRLLADGRCQIFGFLFPGDFLGLTSGNVHLYSADAVGAVTLSRFPRRRVEQLAAMSPLVARLLFCRSSDALVAAQDQMLLLGRKNATEKVASFLLEMARREGGDAFALPMTRRDIGDYLGLTIETVSRTLTRLRQLGLLQVNGSEIEITDRSATEHLAEGC
jgi:CRP/FNR family transcriptional regulator